MTLKNPKLYQLTEDNELCNLILEPTCFESIIRICIDSLLTLTFEIKKFKDGPSKTFYRLSSTNFTWSTLEYFLPFKTGMSATATSSVRF